ncbi:MAG: prolyl oligopeptidase family serine peptidase [Pirellulales bacterium]|nr:prolyl oligopeptidase family serine peptidase [Pirellulales bacterium]
MKEATIPARVPRIAVVVLLLGGVCRGADDVPPPAAGERPPLLTYRSSDGQLCSVRTKDDWAIRRRRILAGMEAVMGPLPDRSAFPPLDVKITKQVEGDGYLRLSITYRADEDDRVPAYLYVPKDRPAGRRVAAVLALHPTSPLGKRVVDGEGPRPNRAYARELAQRGYVVLAPDYPPFGQYAYDFNKSLYASGTMKGIVNHMRGVDLLQAREEVDPTRIGVIGHSLGGHNALFVGAFDERLRAVVSSCGWTLFPDYRGGNLTGWDQPRYMPRMRDVYGLDPKRVPFDFDEVVAALAPRAFFSNSPTGDDNFDVRGVKRVEPRAREVFALLDAADRFQVRYPDCGHDFPPEIRREAYAFLDRALGHAPTRTVP